jgi:hypothetical protein
MTWACFLQCYGGQDAPLYIGCNSQKENRDLPEELWANCPLPNAFFGRQRIQRGKGQSMVVVRCLWNPIWRRISISSRH